MTMIKKFYKDESGATAIEYGLLVALISIAAIAGFNALGAGLLGSFNTSAGYL